MTDKTMSGESTFGIAKHTTVKVESADGTIYVGYHDGDTWYEGHYSEERTKVQMAEMPVRLA